jgi:hypothetical protein
MSGVGWGLNNYVTLFWDEEKGSLSSTSRWNLLVVWAGGILCSIKLWRSPTLPHAFQKRKEEIKRESRLQGPDLFASLFGRALPTCGVVTYVISYSGHFQLYMEFTSILKSNHKHNVTQFIPWDQVSSMYNSFLIPKCLVCGKALKLCSVIFFLTNIYNIVEFCDHNLRL